MKSQTIILLIVAAGCGLVAMLGVQQVLNKKSGDETEKIEVLTAITDIDIGVPLTDMNCGFKLVDKELIPEGALTDFTATEERQLVIPVNVGDWITEKKLGERGLTGKTVMIPDGMQVCTIQVDATTSHSGMLKPGHRVDVMLNYDAKDDEGDSVNKVRRLLQYVEVFAVDDKVYGRDGDGQNAKAKNISLVLSPKHAMYVEMAKHKGRMSTVLRRTGDDTEVAAVEISESDLDSGSDTEIDNRTALDANAIPEFGEAEEEQQDADDIFIALNQSFSGAGSSPGIQGAQGASDDGSWQIVIWEGTTARVEEVDLSTTLPTVTRNEFNTEPGLQGFQVPQPPVAEATEGEEQLEGMEGLKDAASDLWSLFGE